MYELKRFWGCVVSPLALEKQNKTEFIAKSKRGCPIRLEGRRLGVGIYLQRLSSPQNPPEPRHPQRVIEACQGEGVLKVEMHFLPDIYVTCDQCRGARYNRETLEITYRNNSIAKVLDMSVDEAANLFEAIPSIRDKLVTLQKVGLGYVKVGQPATTLSGGEAQRVKLAKELAKRATGKTLYILDEPTTGLHFEDVRKLLEVLHTLVDAGNTVAVIEHNLEVIKTADWIIDMGPEGGAKGGQVVVTGTPESVARTKNSYTGQYLKHMLGGKGRSKTKV